MSVQSAESAESARSAPPAGPAAPRGPLLVIVLIPVFVAFALWAFAWPASHGGPNDLPVGVVGQTAAADRVAAELEAREGAFDIHRYADEASAREAIEDREVYGAFDASGQQPAVLVASAAGPSVAQLLTQIATAQAPEGAAPAVTDVVPAPGGDPRGGAFSTSALPLALAGVAAGAVATLTGLRGGRALAALAGAAVLVGLVGASLAHSWLGVLEGSWIAVAAALALMVLAGAATVAGAAALVGRPGVGLGALIVVLLGNPWSGAGSAPEMLPEPVGLIGQFLPTGAGATLLRSVSFFDGAALAQPLAVLAVWTLLGAAALLLGARRAPRAAGTATARRAAEPVAA
ncbi:ABC transporter permease [Streptomyces sp. DSM 44917]|uniref:ABC transporter permease n=1 Tax=Streptomyces boetiae TaxID=3075541 RepID=A0ABU2LCQ7_9ACTN|nr:ABC transporter permease [Streptomyces sp. DSM 44917]MDT0309082.1 ABC transporter permease [Streptomyces sp. DSM 44917]